MPGLCILCRPLFVRFGLALSYQLEKKAPKGRDLHMHLFADLGLGSNVQGSGMVCKLVPSSMACSEFAHSLLSSQSPWFSFSKCERDC